MLLIGQNAKEIKDNIKRYCIMKNYLN